ncbi:hypothetical protein [Micromonospora sp. NBRC 101691]|uniref:hypothetical protein n=1 Tax=Micromonospora sp. NBRC 101691 TaxID=3032198 RepID=UPI0024A2C979|nr:hypothetical protein [Micromonospora sp. NBRC 101691]GLY21708.1 hypothetical protein Misp04_14400 [Micromonospora sp. NBRC 101691]
MRRPVTVTTGRHPFEVAVLAAALLCGVALTITGLRPTSVTTGMPGTVQAIWQFGLIAAGGVGLAGVWWRGHLSVALGIELVGVATLGTVTTMYAIALYAVSGRQAIAAGAFVAGVAFAAWWRVAQIGVDLHRVTAAINAGSAGDVHLLVEQEQE